MNVIGDVRGRRAIIVDDEIDTAGTLIEIVRALEREGVTEIYACATHGVLSDPAVERIARLGLERDHPHRHGPAAAGKRLPKITTSPSRRSSARRSSASTAANRSGRCSAARCRSPRRCSCGRTALRRRSTREPTDAEAAGDGPGEDVDDDEPSPPQLASAIREADR